MPTPPKKRWKTLAQPSKSRNNAAFNDHVVYEKRSLHGGVFYANKIYNAFTATSYSAVER